MNTVPKKKGLLLLTKWVQHSFMKLKVGKKLQLRVESCGLWLENGKFKLGFIWHD